MAYPGFNITTPARCHWRHCLDHRPSLAFLAASYTAFLFASRHIEAGITLADAVNFLVERNEFVRTDRKGFTWQEQTPFLTATDIVRAKKATGLVHS